MGKQCQGDESEREKIGEGWGVGKGEVKNTLWVNLAISKRNIIREIIYRETASFESVCTLYLSIHSCYLLKDQMSIL